MNGASAPRELGEGLEGSDVQLYGDLRAWRGAAARAARRRPFMVVSEAVMCEIARAKPSTVKELLAVKGIGPKKAEAYSDGLLGVVRDHLERINGAVSAEEDTLVPR